MTAPRDNRHAPVSPGEATQRDQVRRTLNVMSVLAVISGVLMTAQAIASANAGSAAIAVLLFGFAVLLVVWPRRILADGHVESAVMVMALSAAVVILASAIITPSGALLVAILLIPITAAVPYLEARSLRWLMVLTWIVTVATAATGLLPGAPAPPNGDSPIGLVWGAALVSGVVLLLLYQASEKLKASSHDFRRLFSLSSDLAEASEPGVLGDLVARHLAEATGMDDCVIYALSSETGRLTSFGSHPAVRSLQTKAESLSERPLVARVIRDRVQVTMDTANEDADASERDRLKILGRRAMLLLPLVAHSEPVGVAELTSARPSSVDERRLELARTLAFEAAMAIENGRLYHELRERSLHDPLTGLANRMLFFDRVGHAIARLGRNRAISIAVLYVDLDEFKAVNDTYGHARGDRLLVLVAERLLTVVRSVDTVARLGGDEFALLLEDLNTTDGANLVAERALGLLATPFDLAGESVNVGASIGLALRSDTKTGADELIREADEAMYAAKRAGKGRVVCFAPAVERAPVA